ncbi:MAG: hypothetical protein WAO83_25435 [Fuerstiella sp.]
METPASPKRSLLKAILPSSLVSICTHCTILVVASLSFKGCETGVPVEAGGQNYREIGLAMVSDESSEETDIPSRNPQDSTDVRPSEPDAQPVEQLKIPSEMPSLNDLVGERSAVTESNALEDSAAEGPNVIGPGIPISGLPAPGGGLSELIRPSGTSGLGSAGSPTPGPDATSFMNVVGNGTSFVYVIDTSSSMATDGRLALAKSQLKASLRMLRPSQSFQILFYGDSTTQMKLRKRAIEDMYRATAVQVQLAGDEIDRVVANGGTEHMTPLLRALMLEPEVIYFLTDGDQPRLSKADLAEIRRRNRKDAQIHVIEFAAGLKESRQLSWLELLASQSGGTYVRKMTSR